MVLAEKQAMSGQVIPCIVDVNSPQRLGTRLGNEAEELSKIVR